MKRLLRIAAQSLAVLFATPSAHGQIAGFVNPLLGASGGGNVFPGPAVSFGMIKPGPDMINLHRGGPNAGWNANGDIGGFSRTHVSGTGGGAKYGIILVLPTTGALASLDSESPRANEQASVGLYSVALTYLIGSPGYPETILRLPAGRDFTIEARSLSPANLHVTAATLNGKVLDRAWLRHPEIVSGGRLILTLASHPEHTAQRNPSLQPLARVDSLRLAGGWILSAGGRIS